jgi:hypothetical protein
MTPAVRAPGQRRRHRDQRAAHRAGRVEADGELQLESAPAAAIAGELVTRCGSSSSAAPTVPPVLGVELLVLVCVVETSSKLSPWPPSTTTNALLVP